MWRITHTIVLVSSIFTIIVGEEVYSEQYDDQNVLKLLNNDSERNELFACYIGSGPCITAAAKYFKSILPEAMATNCKKCTEAQKQQFATVAQWYTKNRPIEWITLIAKLLQDAKDANIEVSTPGQKVIPARNHWECSH